MRQMVPVRVFHKTSSVFQGPVERHWGDTNMVTLKYKDEFKCLESMGVVDVDDPVDLFCLLSVYMGRFTSDVDAHYRSVRVMEKKKDTANPNYPKGTHLRTQLYRDYPSMKTPLSPAEVAAVASVGDAYNHEEHTLAPHQIDPLVHASDRAARSAALAALAPTSLSDTYIAYRQFTRDLISSPVGISD